MYVKQSLFQELNLPVSEQEKNDGVSGGRGVHGDNGNLDATTSDSSSGSTAVTGIITTVTSSTTTDTSTITDVTTPGGGGDDEETRNKWLVPVLISAGGLVLIVVVLVILYRRWKCFGLSLPFMRKKFQLAQPIKKLTDSMRSSISSSSTRGSLFEGDKQFRKYAVKIEERSMNGEITSADKIDTATVETSGLDWIDEKDFSGEFEAMKRVDLKDIPMTAALKSENISRNRFSNVLPYDKSRVVLSKAELSGNDYINASFVSGHRKEKEFICTQGPLKQTVTDFWRMCWETQAVAIVMLTKCYEKNQEKCYPYWPSGNTGNSTFGDISVTLERKTAWRLKAGDDPGQGEKVPSDKSHLWLVSELRMEKEGESSTQNILHIVFLSWPDFGVVDPPKCLVGFVKNVQSLVQKRQINQQRDPSKDNGPIVVHCSAGVGRSGVFIAVHQLIQQVEEIAQERKDQSQKGLSGRTRTKSVNIFHLVTKMRRERIGMVQNLLQYTLIYKCLQVLTTKNTSPTAENEEPVTVNTDTIQGSDWGLVETNNNS